MSTTSASAPETYVVVGHELDGWIAERRRLGRDGRDEVWNGVYHVVPHAHSSHGRLALALGVRLAAVAAERGLEPTGSFNLGTGDKDYRVPDMGWTSTPLDEATLYVPSVDVVVELVSPGDETWEKVPYYFAAGVREVWVVTPARRTVQILVAEGAEVPDSGVLGVDGLEVRAALGWG